MTAHPRYQAVMRLVNKLRHLEVFIFYIFKIFLEVFNEHLLYAHKWGEMP